MSKDLTIKIIGHLGNNAGVIDGTLEAGKGSIDCQKDKGDILILSATASSNFLSQIGVSSFGGWGAVTATIAGVLKTGKLTWNDAATIGAGLAGAAVEFFKKKPGLIAGRLVSILPQSAQY